MAHLSGPTAGLAQLADHYLDGLQKADPSRPVDLARLAIETAHRASSNIGVVKAQNEMDDTLFSSFKSLEKKGRALTTKA